MKVLSLPVTRLANFRRPRSDKGRKRLRSAIGRTRKGKLVRAAGVLGISGVVGAGAIALRRRRGKGISGDALDAVKDLYTKNVSIPRNLGRAAGASAFEVKRGAVEGFVGMGALSLKKEIPVYGKLARRELDRGVVRHNRAVGNLQKGAVVKAQQVQAQVKAQGQRVQKQAKGFVAQGRERDRAARQQLGQKLYGKLRKNIFGFSRYSDAYILSLPRSSLASFKRGKPLSKQHKLKISRALKGKNRGIKGNRAERSLAIREQEARSRSLRNIGYIANSASDAVREARLTARYLGFGPRGARRSGLRGKLISVGTITRPASGIAKDISSVRRLFR